MNYFKKETVENQTQTLQELRALIKEIDAKRNIKDITATER